MSIEPKVMTYLKANVPSVANRVYWPIAPQGIATPYITISKVSPGRDYTHDGYSGLSRQRFQFSVYGAEYVQTKLTAVEVVDAMEAWKTDGVKFAPVAGEQDLYEQDTGLHHCPVDFFIHYEE